MAIKSASYYNLKEQEVTEYANEIIGIVNSNWEKNRRTIRLEQKFNRIYETGIQLESD